MCLPKALGGIGFRDLEIFNQALLANQVWKLVHQPNSLLARFLKSRYYPNVNFLDAVVGARPSFAWRRVLHGRDLLQKGLKRQVGNGESTRVWIDKWIDDPETGMRAPWIKNNVFDANLMVVELIDKDSRRWKIDVLKELFVPLMLS